MSKLIGVTFHYEDGSVTKARANDIIVSIGAQRQGQYTYLNADECPEHGAWKGVPAGVSQKTGKPYGAFYACDVEQGAPRCTNKPSREWVETHPVGGLPPDQAALPEPKGTPANTADQYDDLPF